MKPYIICHMMESIDGRIDCSMTEKMGSDAYYPALESLNCPSTLEGKVTNIMHNCLPGIFEAKDSTPVGKKSWYKATEAVGYACSVDTQGTLLWGENNQDGTPRLCIIGEQAPKEYADYLSEKGISWIAVGKERIDLKEAMEILNREFGVQRMAVVGGGNINGSFLREGLLDEVSVMYGAAIDGRKGMTAAFDGILDESGADYEPYHLKLFSVEQKEQDTVWVRYKVIRQ